jgi:hypothetical protein
MAKPPPIAAPRRLYETVSAAPAAMPAATRNPPVKMNSESAGYRQRY